MSSLSRRIHDKVSVSLAFPIVLEVGAELGQADKNQVIAAFITGAVSE